MQRGKKYCFAPTTNYNEVRKSKTVKKVVGHNQWRIRTSTNLIATFVIPNFCHVSLHWHLKLMLLLWPFVVVVGSANALPCSYNVSSSVILVFPLKVTRPRTDLRDGSLMALTRGSVFLWQGSYSLVLLGSKQAVQRLACTQSCGQSTCFSHGPYFKHHIAMTF